MSTSGTPGMSEYPMKMAIGLMSGTSMDGIDAALVRTDGGSVIEPMGSTFLSYEPDFQDRLRAALGGQAPVPELADNLTRLHVQAVRNLLEVAHVPPSAIDVVGFHGHTIFHDPGQRITIQIGNGGLLADLLSVDVVDDFRGRDVAAGGEGAPFAPLYHAVLAPPRRPVCFLNIGGVANLTWVGPDADPARDDVFEHLRAFDTGPGNALIDDWMRTHTGASFDDGGRLASRGKVHGNTLETLMSHDYFARQPPKSLDRTDFSIAPVAGLSPEDGSATLAMFTVHAVAQSARYLPQAPVRWLVTGGGRKNLFVMRELEAMLGVPVQPTEAAGIDGDVLEAQAFAYLAVRSLAGRPLSGPTTTGVPAPQTGGQLHAAGTKQAPV
jgi:anhydro-N-acetylmuramic acid kinase